jgi:putative heme iron utilization protein
MNTPLPAAEAPPAQEARAFAHGCHHGVLSTLSKRLEGYPFGSVSPFIQDEAGCPIILISDIAEHSKNLQADPRCSLIMQPFADDMQSTGRVTVIGQAERLTDADKAALAPAYLDLFPQAQDYFAMHDFRFWRIQPLKVRWIGGFGRVYWIDAIAWTQHGQP